MTAVLSRRERLLWLTAFAAIAALLVAARFESRDPDSALYAAITARLSALPAAHWIAPYWFALWPGSEEHELFREHPAGIFLIPAALARLGIPAVQAAYITGVAAALASLLMIGRLVARVASAEEGRAVLVLLQIMPVAFIFRVRSNHEYPMLACLALCLIGIDGAARSWRSAAWIAIGLTAGMMIKGIFVATILFAAGLWILFDPAGTKRRGRQTLACVAGVAVMVLAAVAYDAAYFRVTGQMFWLPYWQRQLGPVTVAAPLDSAATFGRHLVFYLVRLVWHPAPWSVALLVIGWRGLSGTSRSRGMSEGTRRGLAFCLTFVGVSVAIFSLPSRFAERYLFSAIYVLGTCGAVAAWRAWPRLRSFVSRLDAAIPALPVLLWTTLILLRVGLGPWIPRIQDH